LQIPHRNASWLRNARAGSLFRIETVNIDCDVSRAVTHDAPNLVTIALKKVIAAVADDPREECAPHSWF
jgi:hypothetical protein